MISAFHRGVIEFCALDIKKVMMILVKYVFLFASRGFVRVWLQKETCHTEKVSYHTKMVFNAYAGLYIYYLTITEVLLIEHLWRLSPDLRKRKLKIRLLKNWSPHHITSCYLLFDVKQCYHFSLSYFLMGYPVFFNWNSKLS